jgi:glycosyltransferase involved in cell wall biosynthesis
MRIAIINITGGGMSGGYKKYLSNVLPRMANHPEVDEVLCVGHKSLRLADSFDSKPNIHFANCDSFRLLRSSISSDLRKQLIRFSPDVLFIPTERLMRFREVPVVNMVQNMEPLAYSGRRNPVSEKIRNLVRRKVGIAAFARSHRIIAVSHFVKQFLIDEYGIPETKIGVVYHGVSDVEVTTKRPREISEKFKSEFLFTAGSVRPARGLEDIINAIILLARKQTNLNLVIAGSASTNMLRYRSTLEKHIAENGISYRVIWAGDLSTQEMDWCYKNCLAFVMTSRVESFGIIATEAMAAGCVCIAADNSCLPEIFADAATFYPPRNYTLLAEAIANILNFSDQKTKEATQKSLKRREFFNWEACAEQTVAQLTKVVKGLEV